MSRRGYFKKRSQIIRNASEMREQTDHEDFYEAAQGEASDVLDQASLFVAVVEKYLRDQPILYSLR